MKILISFSLLLHMLALGIYLGNRGRPITTRVVGAVFAWMVLFHIGAGVLMSQHLDLVDPRNDS